MRAQGILYDKSKAFALDVIAMCNELRDKNEFVMSKQILRSATSIGANYCEAVCAESPQDFIHKVSISLKEANETENWLNIFRKSELMRDDVYLPIHNKLVKIKILLIKSIQTLKSK